MGKTAMKPIPFTARNASQISCHSCHLLCRINFSIIGQSLVCPRCGSMLHQRKPNSLRRTWALVLAAVIFYIPANLLPVTVVISLGKEQADTIMSGVIYFIHTGMWAIALVIFVASILVPMLKLIMLTFLLITVQRKSAWRPKDRTRLYRITEAIGRLADWGHNTPTGVETGYDASDVDGVFSPPSADEIADSIAATISSRPSPQIPAAGPRPNGSILHGPCMHSNGQLNPSLKKPSWGWSRS